MICKYFSRVFNYNTHLIRKFLKAGCALKHDVDELKILRFYLLCVHSALKCAKMSYYEILLQCDTIILKGKLFNEQLLYANLEMLDC